jgi:protein-tyrosine phosphatase
MTRILFVCMGNICRSPAAEGVLLDQLKRAGLESDVQVDSAGTLDYHVGKLADPRMRAAAQKRGIKLVHHARQVQPKDLRDFDLILVMDRDNLSEVSRLDGSTPHLGKIKLFCEYCTEHAETEVPDPYLGTGDDFELVLDILEDGCKQLVSTLKRKE